VAVQYNHFSNFCLLVFVFFYLKTARQLDSPNTPLLERWQNEVGFYSSKRFQAFPNYI